jgi:molecular chaperone GrpE (heat shock protein)
MVDTSQYAAVFNVVDANDDVRIDLFNRIGRAGIETAADYAWERRIDRLAEMVNDRRRSVRFFTFGLGADVNVALLEQIAVDGGGTAHFVRGGESVERLVSVLASRLREPVLTDVRLVAEGVRLRHVYPAMPTDVFAGEDLVVLAEYVGDGNGQVSLTGEADGRTVRFVHSVQFPERERGNAFVSRLWAARRLGHLSIERRRHGPSPEIDDEIRTLGERYGIPTELSSYLVLEPGVTPPMLPRPVADGRRIRPQVVGEQDFSGRGVADSVAAVTAGAPAPAAPTSGNAAFESARRASGQRTATQLSGVVATGAVSLSEASIAHAGRRTFQMRGGVWTQQGRRPSERIRIKPYSALYFALVSEIEELRDELDALNDRHLRLAAEFDNYRKRNERDRQTLATRLQVDLISSFLEVLDDLERVADVEPGSTVDSVVEGVHLVERKFLSVLRAAGIEPVETEDAPFDPTVMEAMMMVPTDDPSRDGRVADEFQRGYRVGDVLVRPARVRVLEYREPEGGDA